MLPIKILDIGRCILSQSKGSDLENFPGSSVHKPHSFPLQPMAFGRCVYFLSFTNIHKDRPTEFGFYSKNDSSATDRATLLNFLGS